MDRETIQKNILSFYITESSGVPMEAVEFEQLYAETIIHNFIVAGNLMRHIGLNVSNVVPICEELSNMAADQKTIQDVIDKILIFAENNH